jgi:signal transduction histidine kinase
MADERNQASETLERLLAWLDFIERPACLIDCSGQLIGTNAQFIPFLEASSGRSIDRASELFTPWCWGALQRLLETGEIVPGSLPLEFAGGMQRSVRLEPVESGRWTLMIVEVGPSESSTRSAPATRGESMLRHDLAGPITAILGTAELILSRGHELPREMRQDLGQIVENCARMSEILHAARESAADHSSTADA